MVDLIALKHSISGEHIGALMWFDSHRGSTVSWSIIQQYADDGARLVSQAKGIYKPAYSDYALSVRQTLNSPYADKEFIRRADGSWLYPYFQENSDPKLRDREATNRGLMKCMQDSVPVGVLTQKKPKPGVEYRIHGLARVIDWQDGYFFLEGFNQYGLISAKSGVLNVGIDRAKAETLVASQPDFNSIQHKDHRVKTIAEVVRRRGQTKFRKTLLEAYDSKCAITGCDAVEALEAAHITPYLGADTNHPQNGLLLRADIHSLFDLGLLSVDPESYAVVLADSLRGSAYEELHGRRISSTCSPQSEPLNAALKQHFEWASLHAAT